MRSFGFKSLLVAGAAAALLVVYASKTVADANKGDDSESALVTAARATFISSLIAYENDQATLDDLYRWSRRIMRAELKVNPTSKKARLDHNTRMRTLHEKIVALHEAGARGGETHKRDATVYYVEEAKSNLFP